MSTFDTKEDVQTQPNGVAESRAIHYRDSQSVGRPSNEDDISREFDISDIDSSPSTSLSRRHDIVVGLNSDIDGNISTPESEEYRGYLE